MRHATTQKDDYTASNWIDVYSFSAWRPQAKCTAVLVLPHAVAIGDDCQTSLPPVTTAIVWLRIRVAAISTTCAGIPS